MKIHNCFKRHLIIPSVIISVLFSICLIMGCVSTPAKIENSKASLLYQKLIQDNPQSFIEKAYVGAWVTKNSKNEFEIAFIAKNSPAALVDVRVGDIIESIDNLTFRDRAELLRFYDRKEPGDEVNAVIKRNGILINKKVRFGLHHFTNDLYALMKLVATEEPVRLAVVVGDISNVYLQDKTMLDLWTRGMKPILVSNWENTNLQFFKHEPLFSVIDRHKTETLLNELMFQQSGVLKSETQTKLGEILGATHLLVIDFSRFYISSVAVTDVETHKLIEVKSGKVLANALFKTIVQAEKPTGIKWKETTIEANSDAITLNNRGITLRKSGKYQHAIESYNKAIELNPQYADAYNNRGFAYEQLGNHQEAIKDYSKAIELDPQFAMAYNNRGNVYDDLGDYHHAISDYNKAIELDPQFAMAYYNRGLSYHRKKQYDKALEDFNKAIILDPNDAKTYYSRGLVFDDKQQYNRAIEDYTKASTLDPNHVKAYNNRGNIYNNEGLHKRAIEDYNMAIQIEPNFALAYNNRGVVYDKEGKYDMAIEDFNRAIALNPNYADAYNNRGFVYIEKGNMTKAATDFQKACDLGYQVGCANLQKVLQNR